MNMRIPSRYIIDFMSLMVDLQDRLVDYEVVVFSDTAMVNIVIEIIECALGNANRDSLSKACSKITKILTEEFSPIDQEEVYEFVRYGVNELEANILFSMRVDLECTPDKFTFVVDPVLKRAEITYEDLPRNSSFKRQDVSSIALELARADLLNEMEAGTRIPASLRQYFNI